jgi:hypothetical protein
VEWWWWLVVILTKGCLSSGEEAEWWWCHGVVVVRERMCGGVHSVDIEKRYKENLTFFLVCRFQVRWVPLLTVVASIALLGAAWVIHLAGEGSGDVCE